MSLRISVPSGVRTSAITAETWEEWKAPLKELGHPDKVQASRWDLAALYQGEGPAIIKREAVEAFLKALPLELRREVMRTRTRWKNPEKKQNVTTK
ncbi:hypothetical protein E2C01_043436 [Portunus trituberculatus]|uniref:Uncharacterized protein n=1 Tax=Portunus trituberculatus TaxID=210409 RepID=A0A5B7FXK5_PORTR|nr:hypothetical protein [Portunus trituberculatus]